MNKSRKRRNRNFAAMLERYLAMSWARTMDMPMTKLVEYSRTALIPKREFHARITISAKELADMKKRALSDAWGILSK